MSETTFYLCKDCGNLVAPLHRGSCTPQCCGKPMVELKANSTDAAQEKHVPICTRKGDTVEVQVGSTLHPMEEKHHIMWIALSQRGRLDVRFLHPGEEPKAVFEHVADSGATVYAYCNLHGLWKAEL